MVRRRLPLALALTLTVACTSDPAPGRPEANPLGTLDNVLPFPSSVYERADGDGVVLDVPVGALPPHDVTGLAFDPAPINRRHGWPASTTIVWAIEGGVDPAGLVGPAALADSLTDASATVRLDMTTGARVAHFAEVDVNELDSVDRQAVYIRPAARLAGGHRYAVGVRRALRSAAGAPLPISAGFQAVLDDRATGHARLDAARPRLREAVAALEAAGVARTDLVVAWDFTVTPDADAVREPLAARDAALAAMGPLGANVTYAVTSDLGTINDDPRITRRIELTFAPPAIAGPGNAGFFRDASGAVMVSGTMTAKAYVMVPPCATAATPAGVLLYGHGIFGSLQELRDGEYARDLGAEGCHIVVGTEWTGFSNKDIPDALYALNDVNLGWGLGQHIFQGVVNTITLAQLVRGKLATELLVDDQGRSIVDPARVAFLGVSMGHVLGATFFAYDPFVSRGVFHVGGANWALMLERSNAWAAYGLPLKSSYATLLDAVIMQQVLQMALEPVDGATVAGMALPGAAPDKRYLMQTSLHDASVPNLASFYQARSLGLPRLASSVVEPWGFAAPVTSSDAGAFVVVDEHPASIPPTTNEVFQFNTVAHENPRRRTAVQAQMQAFWATGTAADTCTGGCDCAAGNCGALRTAAHGGT